MTMPLQELEDKLTEFAGILQAQQKQITEIAAAQQKMTAMLAAEVDRLTAAKKKIQPAAWHRLAPTTPARVDLATAGNFFR